MTNSPIIISTKKSSELTKTPTRVLSVDDDSGFLKITKQILEVRDAFQVDTALSVDEALNKLKKTTYDAVVSDYQMPGKDGLQFLKELRESGNTIPFIIFTGKGREEIAIQALNHGADGYYIEIGDPETVYGELIHGIRQIVETNEVREERAKLLQMYGERVKELTCLYGLNRLVEDPGISTEEIFQRTTRLLSSAYQYPDVICAKVVFEEQEYKTKNYKETPWKQQADIKLYENKVGSIQVYYLEERPLLYEGPFLKEERNLIDAVAERLGIIIEQKKAKERLSESEEKYRRIYELAPDGIITANRRGVITSVNSAFLSLTGFSEDEIVGKNFTKIGTIRLRDIPRYIKLFSDILKGKTSTPIEFEYIRKDGTLRWGEVHSGVLKEGGKTVGFQAILRDITERKEASERIKASEEKLRRFIELAPDGIVSMDVNGVITSQNTAASRISGYPKGELIGNHFLNLGEIPAKDLPRLKELFTSIMKGKEAAPSEVTLLRKDGSPYFVEVSIGVLKENGKTAGLQAIFRDITERKEAEKAIQESEERYRLLFESAREGITITGHDGKIIRVNKAGAAILGYDSPEELVGVPVVEFYMNPEDRVAQFEKLMEKGYVDNYECTIKKKDGSPLHIIGSNSTRKDEDGKILQTEAFFMDITERKKASRKLETLNEKLEVVGGLTRHDVNNKLATVRANIYLAKQGLADDNQALEHLREIESAVGQAEQIFDFAKFYERLGVEELDYMRVEDAVEGACNQFSDLRVRVANDCGGLRVLADSLLNRLFYNLIDNSLKHSLKKPVKIRCCYEEEKDVLRLVYEDDGVGIPTAEKEKVFEQSYGKGSGLGLYLIKKMCEVYGWTIKEAGVQGEGVRFIMTLPKVNVREGKLSYIFKK